MVMRERVASIVLGVLLGAPLVPLMVGGCDAFDDKKDDNGRRDPGGPGGNSQVGYTSVIFTEASAQPGAALVGEPQTCNIGLTPTVQTQGTCLSPMSVELWANGVFLGSSQKSESSDPAHSGPGRLLGGGSGFGRDGAMEGARVKLAEATSIRGEDNLFHHYESKTLFDQVGVETAYVRTAFEINDSTWEMIVPFYDQPVSEIAVLKECYDQPYIDQALQKATLLEGLSFTAGDYLFCERQDAKTPCDLTDFQFFDVESQSLVTERPAQPKRLESLTGLRRVCNRKAEENTPPDASYQMPGLRAALNTPVRVYADFSHGRDSQTNPSLGRPAGVDEATWSAREAAGKRLDPHFVYFIEGDSGTSTGNKLDVELSFDNSGWILLEGISDLEDVTPNKFLSALTTRSFFAWESIGFETLGGIEPGWKADITLSTSKVSLEELYQD